MALTVGELVGYVDLDDRDFNQKTDRAEGRFRKLGSSFGAMAGIYATVAGGAMVAAGSKLFDHAAQLEAMGNKAETVFGDQMGLVTDWAKANASAMGLTNREAEGLAANFADLLIPMGFAREEAAKMSTGVVGLSGALSQWSNGERTAAEVSQILAKAMLGEREGLKELGISITEADVQARLLGKSQDKLTGTALEQAKAIATQELIFEKSTDAQAAYEKGASKLIKTKMELKAKAKTLYDELSARLIPVFSKLADWALDKIGPAFDWLSSTVIPALTNMFSSEGSGALGGALTGVLGVMGMVKDIFLMAWPAIKDVVGQFIGWFASEEGQALLKSLLDAVLTAAQAVFDIFTAVWPTIKDTLFPLMLDLIDAIMPLVTDVLEVLTPLLTEVVRIFTEVWAGIAPVLGPIVSALLDILGPLIEAVAAVVNGMKWLAEHAGGPPTPVTPTGADIVNPYTGRPLVPEHAIGGLFSTPHVGMVAEAGPELILPLSKPRRTAELMGQAGLGFDTSELLAELRGLRDDFKQWPRRQAALARQVA